MGEGKPRPPESALLQRFRSTIDVAKESTALKEAGSGHFGARTRIGLSGLQTSSSNVATRTAPIRELAWRTIGMYFFHNAILFVI
jgi:hypothetical protein